MARRKHKRSGNSKKDLLFHLLLLLWPVLQFAIFYIYVNINSFILAFNFGEVPDGGAFYYFKQVFAYDKISNSYPYFKSMLISVILWLASTAISVPAALLFGYFISRKFLGSKFFRFILFLPSILSATVMVVIITKFNDLDLYYLLAESTGSTDVFTMFNVYDLKTYLYIVLFDCFIGFGTTTLIYSNRMSEISPEIFEAAQLDGFNHFREFFNIVLPHTFPTLSTFLITGLASVFVNQYNLFTFFGASLGVMEPGPIGYVIYNQVQGSAVLGIYDSPQFHQMAALGLVCTLFLVPVVLTARHLLERFGPKEK